MTTAARASGWFRRSLPTLATAALFATLALEPALAADPRAQQQWVGSWSASPQEPTEGDATNPGFSDQTVRQIVRVSLGGSEVRVRLSNAYGTTGLRVGAAHVALRSGFGAAIDPATDRTLNFGGSPSFTVPAGALAVSDPVVLDVPDLGEVVVTLYFPGDTGQSTIHRVSSQTSYISPPGDYTSATEMPVEATNLRWYYLSGVEVMAPKQTGAVVTIGDSITDGTRSTPDTNNRWPDHLAERILAHPGNHRMGVLNQGISGNRVLRDGRSANLLARFDRDVLSQTGVTHVVVLESINDIGQAFRRPEEPASAEELIQALRQVIARAHEKDLQIFGATLTPYQGASYFSPEGEAKRQAINEWIRTSGEWDGVIDFDLATRDPANPTWFLPAYDSGDHLHPNDLGYQAMADAVNLTLFGAAYPR